MANETVFTRHPGNPVVTAAAVPRANSIHNSAIVKRAEGDYAGVFRVDEISMSFTLHVGFSPDGVAWEIDPEPLRMESDDPDVFVTEHSYDPRLTRLGDTYYLTWCNAGPQGPAIGLATTQDFETFTQWENPLPPANRNCVVFPRKLDGEYAIYHRPSDRGHTPFGDIFYATSPDLVHW
ncbi:MAG TPA: glycosidase, partial [Gaiellaceae bacterium]|nr:glycosidase [Gaiellaceae bacterium]